MRRGKASVSNVDFTLVPACDFIIYRKEHREGFIRGLHFAAGTDSPHLLRSKKRYQDITAGMTLGGFLEGLIQLSQLVTFRRLERYYQKSGRRG